MDVMASLSTFLRIFKEFSHDLLMEGVAMLIAQITEEMRKEKEEEEEVEFSWEKLAFSVVNSLLEHPLLDPPKKKYLTSDDCPLCR